MQEEWTVPVITGPTAVGKTELSLRVAEQLQAEIISCDSRQVYRELNIGTATPPPYALERVRHHFIDERRLTESFSAGEFAREAETRIDAIREAGGRPLVVGGSTLYLYALQRGMAEIPPVPSSVRDGLRQRLGEEGSAALFDELRQVDPPTAARMDATKTQRLLRALEVYHASGKPLSYYHREARTLPRHRYRTVVLHLDRDRLYDRINRRVNEMLDEGLVAEVHPQPGVLAVDNGSGCLFLKHRGGFRDNLLLSLFMSIAAVQMRLCTHRPTRSSINGRQVSKPYPLYTCANLIDNATHIVCSKTIRLIMTNTIQDALQDAQSRLKATSETPRLDAQVLLAHVLNKPKAYLLAYPEQSLTDAQQTQYQALITRRADDEPVAYLVGEKGFWDVELLVSSDVLVPRPETEHLIEAALVWARQKNPALTLDEVFLEEAIPEELREIVNQLKESRD